MGADPVIYPARQSQRIGLTPAYLLRQSVDQGCEADVRVLLARPALQLLRSQSFTGGNAGRRVVRQVGVLRPVDKREPYRVGCPRFTGAPP